MHRRFLSVAVFSIVAVSFLPAQDAFTRVFGTEDQQIAIPSVATVRGKKDPGAMQELITFLKATRLASFTDMKGTGTALLPSQDGDTSALPATVIMRGANQFRLDIQAPAGTRTILIDGVQASVRHESKATYPLPPTAAALAVVAFARPALTDFSGMDFSLIDRGMVTVAETQLHRITVQSPFSRKNADKSGHNVDLAMDLYFDTTSHLLVKSAAAIRLNDGGSQEYLRVTTYGDYRQVGDMLIPFSYHETLNGQREWTLQLNDIQLNTRIDSSAFQIGQ